MCTAQLAIVLPWVINQLIISTLHDVNRFVLPTLLLAGHSLYEISIHSKQKSNIQQFLILFISFFSQNSSTGQAYADIEVFACLTSVVNCIILNDVVDQPPYNHRECLNGVVTKFGSSTNATNCKVNTNCPDYNCFFVMCLQQAFNY